MKLLFRFEAALATLAYVVALLALLADITARQFFGTSLIHAGKVALFAAIFAGMLGMGLATTSGTHFRPKFADNLFSYFWQKRLQRLGDIFSGLLFLLAAYIAFELVRSSYEIGFLVPVLDWKLWWFQLILPYAFCSNALRHLLFAFSPSIKPTDLDLE
ncbi:TRAP transporter small permease [Pseudovibrio axinellae]|uniref:TRAP transporter small permease n=1 Tax=Pseudovibrio axinellae TaxID=989403 RepID=UPI00137A0797|nr:TRAP transporter small permease subunit [Pseudovibrio axinellae]